MNSIKGKLRSKGCFGHNRTWSLEAQLSKLLAGFSLRLKCPGLYYLLIGILGLLSEDSTVFPAELDYLLNTRDWGECLAHNQACEALEGCEIPRMGIK